MGSVSCLALSHSASFRQAEIRLHESELEMEFLNEEQIRGRDLNEHVCKHVCVV